MKLRACGVLADENAAHCLWLGSGFQSLGVGASGCGGSLTVGVAAGPFEDGVIGRADFVEEAHGVCGSFRLVPVEFET